MAGNRTQNPIMSIPMIYTPSVITGSDVHTFKDQEYKRAPSNRTKGQETTYKLGPTRITQSPTPTAIHK